MWRWMFPARNRLIAALSALTVVVEARRRSGALVTAAFAGELGRPVGAVPGRVTSPPVERAERAAGARSDGHPRRPGRARPPVRRGQPVVPAAARPRSTGELETLLEAIAAGHDTAGALARAGFPAEQGLAALASLELAGYVRREPGGRYAVTT